MNHAMITTNYWITNLLNALVKAKQIRKRELS